MTQIRIRPFRAADQFQARALILAGLAEHFGQLDLRLNTDINEIAQSYIARGSIFLVAEVNGFIVATGGLVEEDPASARIVRMSVMAAYRRQGIARRLVARLVDEARRAGYQRVLVETNIDWHDALALYRRCGFRALAFRSGEMHLFLSIAEDGGSQRPNRTG